MTLRALRQGVGGTLAAEGLHCYWWDAMSWTCFGILPALSAGSAGGCQETAVLVHYGLPTAAGLGWASSVAHPSAGTRWVVPPDPAWPRGDCGCWQSQLGDGLWHCNPTRGSLQRVWLCSGKRERRVYLRAESTKWSTHLWPPASDATVAQAAELVLLPPCWLWLMLAAWNLSISHILRPDQLL